MLILLLYLSILQNSEAPTISNGERINLEEHLEEGKYVIFDFYMEWSSPARKWTTQAAKLAKMYPQHISHKRIKMKSFGTPAAMQHNVNSLPFFKLYTPNGKLKRKGHARSTIDFLEKRARKKKW